MYKHLLALGLLSTIISCNEVENKRDILDKLRALGVSSDPVVAEPGSLVTLTFYAVVPLNEEIAFKTFEDKPSVLTPSIKGLDFTSGSEAYEDFAHFRLFSVKAEFTVPVVPYSLMKGNDAARLRYSVQFNSPGEEEKVVGDVMVRPTGSKELAWQSPTAKIILPGGTIDRDDEVDIEGKITNPNEEDLKIGWYASDGTIVNRRSKETTWETSGDKKQTLVLTVRGKQSRGFAVDVVDFEAE